jgi:type IV pilus assembly protein PilB
VTSESTQLRRRRIGEVLVEQGVLTDETLHELLAAQSDPSRPVRPRLGRLVVERGLATEREVANALASALNLPFVNLAPGDIDPDTARLLPRAQAERYGTIVLRRTGDIVMVATTDPTNVLALDDIRLRTSARTLQVGVITETQLTDQLAQIWSLSEDSGEVGNLLDSLDDQAATGADIEAADSQVDMAPIVRLVDRLIADAVSQRASDVHVEPGRGPTRVRFRIDGLLRDVMTVPRAAHASLISRMKILSGMDIAERRVPQDGRARFSVGHHDVEARVSTLPSMNGEKIVLRLLARADDVASVASLGLNPVQREAIDSAMASPQGLILITGPTGSGKTSTLYALLREANLPDRNIVTLEDPVEIAMPGITQVQVHERAGLTFAKGLRSVLRQDPDMVLVGEVRDTETAELALQASMTGHLVLTTLHTNDSVAALSRLVDMGVEPFLVASSLTMVAAQRLVRRPCPDCARPYQPETRTLAALSLTPDDLVGTAPMKGEGCSRCGGTGYRGRLGVYEVLTVTPAIRAVLLATPTEAALGAAARAAGFISLRSAAIAAAGRGETTYEEVVRVTTTGQLRSTGLRPKCRACHRTPPEELDDLVCCPWCGTDTEAQACPGCHRRTAGGWRTCPHCRTPLRATGANDQHVLVVQPERDIGTALGLSMAGEAHLDIVSDVETALRVLTDNAPDVVVVDVGGGTRASDLPRTELDEYGRPVLTVEVARGADFIRLMRADLSTENVPIIALGADRNDFLGLADITVVPREISSLQLADAIREALAARIASLPTLPVPHGVSA